MDGLPARGAAGESECRLATTATVAPIATTTSNPIPLSSRAFRRRGCCSGTCSSAVCGCWAVGGPQDACCGAGCDPNPNCQSGSGRPLPDGAENCCWEGVFAPGIALPGHCGVPGWAPKAVVGASDPPGPDGAPGAPEFHCPPKGFGLCDPPGAPGVPKPCGDAFGPREASPLAPPCGDHGWGGADCPPAVSFPPNSDPGDRPASGGVGFAGSAGEPDRAGSDAPPGAVGIDPGRAHGDPCDTGKFAPGTRRIASVGGVSFESGVGSRRAVGSSFRSNPLFTVYPCLMSCLGTPP